MSAQRHNPRECWCGIDHGRCEKCGGPKPNALLTCSLDDCPHAPFATIIAPFDNCANCGSTASENVTWNRTGGWTCAACGESDYPEATE